MDGMFKPSIGLFDTDTLFSIKIGYSNDHDS